MHEPSLTSITRMLEPLGEEFTNASWLVRARGAMDPVEPCDPGEDVI